MELTIRADATGFIDLPGIGFIADPWLTRSVIDLMIVTVAPPKSNYDLTLTRIQDACDILAEQKFPLVSVIRGETKWMRIISDRRPGDRPLIVGALQGMPPTPNVVEAVRQLKSLGVSVIAPVYDTTNQYGGGYLAEGGLTGDGDTLVRSCLEEGIIVDLAHANDQTAEEILAICREMKAAPMVSHTGVREAYPCARNLPLRVLRQVVELSGIIGVYTLTFGLDDTDNSLEPFLGHVRYLLEEFDADHVCIGSDGWYKSVPEEVWRLNFDQMVRKYGGQSGNGSPRFPDQPKELNTPKRMELTGLEISRHFEGVCGNVLSSQLCGESLIRFLQKR